MAEGKKSFTAYCDWILTFENLNDEEAGILIKHILRYVNDEHPESNEPVVKYTFPQIKATLKRDLRKWESKREQNRENARKRWDKNNADECDRIQTDAKHAVSVSVSDSVSDIVLKNEKNIKDLDVNLDDGEGKFKDQLKNDLKEWEEDYSESDFIEDWIKCRTHFMKQPTSIDKLLTMEKVDFKKALGEYSKRQIKDAMVGLFSQKNKNIGSMYLRPKHFLEPDNISKYLTAFGAKEFELYGKEKEKVSL